MMVPAPIELPGQSDNTPVEINTDSSFDSRAREGIAD